jgi:hypothetical protein
VARVESVTALNLGGSQALTDDGLRYLARLPRLKHLDVSGTAITDRGLAVLRDLPALETLSLAGTRLTDEGAAHLAQCHELRRVSLGWTRTGDGALRALAGKARLHDFASGKEVTDAGIALLHELPVFKSWHGGEPKMALLSYHSAPNHLWLRGRFTDRGMEHMRGLDGLFGLNVDDRNLAITAAALRPLVSLPNLGWLGVDAKDDWMPLIAEIPRLRFLGAQDTVAGDGGFVALSRSKSIEYIWGRRCHNLRRTGFLALANMPALRGLSVSCLNVDDVGISALPTFPALKELMPMDIPDAGYRHVGRCEQLDSLILMYCRDTTDAATEQITPVHVMAAEARDPASIHDALHEIVPLHAVLVRGAVGEMRERRLAEPVLLELPVVAQVPALVEPDRPIVVLTEHGVHERLPLRMALDAGIVGPDEIELCRVHDVRRGRLPPVLAARTVATLAADVPLGDRFRLRVVIDRMAPIAERSGRPLHVVRRVKAHPPVRVRLHRVRAPYPVRHVPLRRQRVVIVAELFEVALFPLRAVHERDVVQLECEEWIDLVEVWQHHFRVLSRIGDDVGHARFRPRS